MIITPSFFGTFYQGYYPGRNAGLQSGDICPGGRPEALAHVFITAVDTIIAQTLFSSFA
jgi:hypothetical protein